MLRHAAMCVGFAVCFTLGAACTALKPGSDTRGPGGTDASDQAGASGGGAGAVGGSAGQGANAGGTGGLTGVAGSDGTSAGGASGHGSGGSAGIGAAGSAGADEPTQPCDADLNTDPANCGACGYACAGDLPCEQGQCAQVVHKLALGGNTSCALMEPANAHGGRDLWCWGANGHNQLRDDSLGTGDDAYRSTPALVPGIGPVRDVVVGMDRYGHICALDDITDNIMCWGNNQSYQLGSDAELALGDVHVAAWSGPVDLAAGADHTCFRSRSGAVWCWGGNRFGQLGRATETERSHDLGWIDWLSGVAQVAAGPQVSCARYQDGTVDCWGVVSALSRAPVMPVVWLDGTRLTDVTGISFGGISHGHLAAEFSACAIRANRTLACWGMNTSSQDFVDFPEDHPIEGRVVVAGVISGLGDVVGVAIGRRFLCALDAKGQVHCWGDNGTGVIEVEQEAWRINAPVPMPGLDDVVELKAGDAHICARRRSGQVVCWGQNGLGQIGDGTTRLAIAPRNVVGLPL